MSVLSGIPRPGRSLPLAALMLALALAALPARATITGAPTQIQAAEGASFTGTVIAFTDTDNVTAANFTNISINWGDGSTSPGTVSGGAGVYAVSGTHIFAEEGSFNLIASFHDTLNNANASLFGSTANVTDAALVPPGLTPPTSITGVGTANVTSAIASFEAAIGGVNNGNNPPPQSGGFRTINWDGVKLDGTDFGGGSNTTVIVSGKNVGIPVNRFQERGVMFQEVYSVSGDGFASVNPNLAGLLPAFSPKNIFAMFNANVLEVNIVLSSAHTTTPTPAAVRGFGAVFLNVELPNTSSIEYFSGPESLGKFYVPVGAQGQPEFLGVLFNQPIVTRVVLTLGTADLYDFDGATVTSGPADNPGTGVNLVATDDFVYAEPTAPAPAGPGFGAVAGIPFTGVVGSFADIDPNGNANDYTATINWGDGHQSAGTLTSNGSGGFNVSGTNTYVAPGLYNVSLSIQDFGGTDAILNNTANVAAWHPVDVAVGSDNKARLLWDRYDGAISVWSVDSSGNPTPGPVFGPFAGYTATHIAAGSDGYTRILWNKTDGTAALWLLNLDNTLYADYSYGPFAGWAATDVTVGKDNLARLLWSNTGGQIEAWNVDNAGNYTFGPVYGPYSGFTATRIAAGFFAGSDIFTRVLWSKTDGTAALWFLDPNNNYAGSVGYGPYAGWSPTDIAVGADNQTRLLWNNLDGHVTFWSIDDSGVPSFGLGFGPYPGYTAGSIAAGGDTLTRVLWNHVSGIAALWLVNADNSYNFSSSYGPY